MLKLILLLSMLQANPIPYQTFDSTAYAWTGYRCATMVYPIEGRTIAVDPDVIPLGSWVYIKGLGFRHAEDTGGAIHGKIIDVFIYNEADCVQYGRRDIKIFVLPN